MNELFEAILRGEAPLAPILRLLGARFTSYGGGEATFELDVEPTFANVKGTLQGGVICVLADAACGFAFGSTLAPGQSLTTVELKTNYLRPISTGTLVARARVLNRGRTTGLIECHVTDENKRLIAHATSTYMVIADQGSPPTD